MTIGECPKVLKTFPPGKSLGAQGGLWLIRSLKLATNHSFKFRLQDRIKSNRKERRKSFIT